MSLLPFSPPRMDEKITEAVKEVLLSGWITTGPKTKLFEKKLTEYTGSKATLCLNSATAGLEIMLRWFGVGDGDEVIVPAYTYSATANVCMHVGARPVLVDINPHDFNISVEAVRKAITPRTKVIMPVDFAGMPCDMDELNAIVNEENIRKLFKPGNEIQQQLGRILILSDAAHSIGAQYKGKRTGSLCDVAVFSFHAVKNLTTAEGGAVALNLPAPFDNEAVYKYLCIKTLHGQNKDALAKTQRGAWRYDILEPGYKCNMMDIQAAIGLVELERYDEDNLVRRKQIAERYIKALSVDPRFELPVFETADKISCYHLFPLRIRGCNEEQRDAIIDAIFARDISVNVHFIPLPLLSFYKSEGYVMSDYPVAYDNYSREISLPLYYNLSDEDVDRVIAAVFASVEEVLKA
ncbi:MAG TPA: DegT/DnrJ/EryC1/StrS aminotransferase family protein [Flavobacteriales bacterium]|nr:capsular biosynthesis protein [Flavobacteriales bacterium]HRE97901.1 DegT/DnrJ/EryC1/StrS aminotransferase family protein [Flavobacteriales bacterium]HRJ34684.1 DegT/DnrJ/EryC1/StrS aminotransferase family protein [Flavobacteriales bacterium]HRJ37942.1 DegT/DnrJ/EryC1/StrS aminotransferase family protein [Flavobacteriales bacterium]